MIKNKNIPFVVAGLFAVTIITFAVWYTKTANTSRNQNEASLSEITRSDEQQFIELEESVNMGLVYDGIHPDLYDSMVKKVSELEAAGFNPTRIQSLKTKMEQLSVGGRENLAAKKPVSSLATNPVPSTPSQTIIAQPKTTTTPLITPSTKKPAASEPSQIVESKPTIVAKPAPPVPPSYPKSPAGWKPPSTCTGTAVTFTDSPVSLSQINHIIPLGQMSASHITPTDHGYILNGIGLSGNISDLRSPADGFIVSIGAFKTNDYRFIMWHSCTVSTIYIHAFEIAPEILAAAGNFAPGDKTWEADQGPVDNQTKPIPVKAGQVIGKIKDGVDFSVHDTAKILSGFVHKSFYYSEAWKIHTVDLFDYFASDVRSLLMSKSLRTVAPVGGKIDYDIDGRLVGSWFREGTNGYKGNGTDCTYYTCHLAIAYDNVFPDQIRVAIPNSGIDQSVCNTCFNAFGVKGNGPDPANIRKENGLVKYELVGLISGKIERHGLHPTVSNEHQPLGVILMEMLSDRQLKVQVFPGKTAAEVNAFTEAARLYER